MISCLICQQQTKNRLFCDKCAKPIAKNMTALECGLEPTEGGRYIIAVSRRLHDSIRFKELLSKHAH